MKSNKNFKKILEAALKLDDKQRAELAKRLLESLEGSIDEDVEQAWLEEIKRRKSEIESGEVRLIPAEEVMRRINLS